MQTFRFSQGSRYRSRFGQLHDRTIVVSEPIANMRPAGLCSSRQQREAAAISNRFICFAPSFRSAIGHMRSAIGLMAAQYFAGPGV
jgi:hypothetical protein